MEKTKAQNRLVKVILGCVSAVVWVRALFGRKPEKWPQKSQKS